MATKRIDIDINVDKNGSTENIDSVSSSLRSMMKGIGAINSGISSFDSYLRSYNNAMSRVNDMYVRGLKTAGHAIYGFTSDAIKSYSDLENQHARTLGAMANDYGKSISQQKLFISNGEKLKQQAIDLAKNGSNGKGSLVGPTEISAAQTALVKSGKSAKDILDTKAVDVIVNFAKGNDLDMDTAVDFAVTLGKQFNYPMEKWGEMLDQVSHAADTSIIEVEDIVNSMKYAGGIASGLDRPMSEILAMLSTMGNAGLKGSVAGTGVQALFTRLLASGTVITDEAISKAPGKSGKAYETFYDDVMDDDGNMLDMDTVLAELDGTMEDLNDEEQAWFARKVFSMFQMKAAYALTGSEDTDVFTQLKNEIANNSDGTNQKKFDLLLASQYGQLKALGNAWDAVQTDLGEQMSPMVKAISGELLKYLQNNGKYNIDITSIRKAIDESNQNIAKEYGKDLADFISGIADTLVNGGMIGEALLPEVGGIGNAFVKVFNGDIGGAFDELSGSLSKTNSNIESLPDDLQEMATAVKNVIIALTALATINTIGTVAQSATSIWGVTGGAVIGGIGLAKAAGKGGKGGGVGNGVGAATEVVKESRSQRFARKVDDVARSMDHGNSLYSGASGVVDNIFGTADTRKLSKPNKIQMDELKRLQDLADGSPSAKSAYDSARGRFTEGGLKKYQEYVEKLANADTVVSDVVSKFPDADALKVEVDKLAKGRFDSNRAMTDYHLALGKYNTELSKMSLTDLAEYTGKLTFQDIIGREQSTLLSGGGSYSSNAMKNFYKSIGYNGVANYTNDQTTYDYFSAINKYLEGVNGNTSGNKDLTDLVNRLDVAKGIRPEVIDSANGNQSWIKDWKNTTAKVTDKVSDANLVKELEKRTIEEAKERAKAAAKTIEETKARQESEDVIRQISKATKSATTDLVDVAKKASDSAAKIGETKPYNSVSAPVKNAATEVVKEVVSDATKTNVAPKVSGASKTLSASADDIAEEAAKVLSKTKSATKSVGVTMDDVDSAFRQVQKSNFRKTLTQLNKSMSLEDLRDSISDMKGRGFSADDIVKSLESKAAKIVEDSKPVTPTKLTFGKTMKNLGKIGANLAGGFAFDYLQDKTLNASVKASTGGAYNSWFDMLDDALKGNTDHAVHQDMSQSEPVWTREQVDDSLRTDRTNRGEKTAMDKYRGSYLADFANGEGIDYTGFSDDVKDVIGKAFEKSDKNGKLSHDAPSISGYMKGLAESYYNMAAKANILPVGNKAKEKEITTFVDSLMSKYNELQSKRPMDQGGYTLPHADELGKYMNEYLYNKTNPGVALFKNLIGSDKLLSGLDISNRLQVQQPINFNPSVNVNVTVDQTGKLLNTTTMIPNFSNMASWVATMASRTSE